MNARSTDLSDERVQRVAEITAALADPFAARETVLASAGLDTATWARMESECTERLQQDTSGMLCAVYAESFARAAAGRYAHARDPGGHHDARFLSPAQPWRDEAAAVSIEVCGEAPRLLSVGENDTQPFARASIAAGDLDATAEIALAPRRATLPFVQPPPPSRRLHRFDTQTGLPLPNPIWIADSATHPSRPL